MMVSISIGQRRGPSGFEAKDTLRNIQDTGVYCVHLVEEDMAAAMDNSAAEYPADVSEIDALGLSTTPTSAIDGVRLTDARVAMECKLLDVHVYGRKGTFNLVIGEVVRVHVDDGRNFPVLVRSGYRRRVDHPEVGSSVLLECHQDRDDLAVVQGHDGRRRCRAGARRTPFNNAGLRGAHDGDRLRGPRCGVRGAPARHGWLHGVWRAHPEPDGRQRQAPQHR